MRDLLAFWFLTAISLTLTSIFVLMWFTDSVRVCDGNLVARIFELVVFFALALFGIERMVTQIRRLLKQYSKE